jgi:hypothetical protein
MDDYIYEIGNISTRLSQIALGEVWKPLPYVVGYIIVYNSDYHPLERRRISLFLNTSHEINMSPYDVT